MPNESVIREEFNGRELPILLAIAKNAVEQHAAQGIVPQYYRLTVVFGLETEDEG